MTDFSYSLLVQRLEYSWYTRQDVRAAGTSRRSAAQSFPSKIRVRRLDMDLPTCPSCGQSVLDDDAVECPFCGAAMDGSSPSKKKPTASASSASRRAAPAKDANPSKKAKAPAATADNDDPFAIAQNPAAAKAIRCAPKPMKGRLHKVVCPMCDTPGFIPKAAVGRQVKCANKECLVPIFTAGDSDGKQQAKAPARISDDEPAIRKKSKTDKPSNPMIKYGIVGAVALLATFGLVSFLNKPGVEQLGPADITFNNPATDTEDIDPDTNIEPGEETKDPPKQDPREAAQQLIAAMIDSARANAGNRDKPFCRQLTADAYFRLGMEEEARAELQQMQVLASSRGRDARHYPIAPLVAQYWRKLKAGDAAGASVILAEAVVASEEMPTAVVLAQDSAIALASAMMNSGDMEAAMKLIAAQQRDATVSSQQDQVAYGSWSATASRLMDAGRSSMPPFEVFAWKDPLMTAVAVDLSLQGQWEKATEWASSLPDLQAASDTFAVIAKQMVAANAPETVRSAIATAAEAKGGDVALRVHSVLAMAGGGDVWFTKAASAYASLPSVQVARLGTIVEVISAKAPDLDASRLRANAIADFVAAAAQRGATDQAIAGLQRLTEELMSSVPPTNVVRRAGGEIDRDDKSVEAKVKQALGLSNANQVRSRFTAYRRSLDNLIRAAEERRFLYLQLLSRIVQNGGLASVQAALQKDGGLLQQEVSVDGLSGMLYVSAATVGQEFTAALQTKKDLAVPAARVARTDPLPEQAITPILVKAWQQYSQSPSIEAVGVLEAGNNLSGIRSAMAEYMTELIARDTESPEQLVSSVETLNSELWRERCLTVISRVLGNRGMSSQVQQAMAGMSLTPLQRVLTLYGLARTAIDSAANTASAPNSGA